MQYLGNALQRNTVSYIFCMCIHIVIGFIQYRLSATLNLRRNQIGVEGAQHLANALKMNRVRHLFFDIFYLFTEIFNADTNSTQSWMEWNWFSRGTVFGWSIKTKHGKKRFYPCITSNKIIPHRHLRYWILGSIILATKGYDTWLLHYNIIRWVHLSNYFHTQIMIIKYSHSQH